MLSSISTFSKQKTNGPAGSFNGGGRAKSEWSRIGGVDSTAAAIDFADVYSDDRHRSFMQTIMQLLQCDQFRPAWFAPGRKKVPRTAWRPQVLAR